MAQTVPNLNLRTVVQQPLTSAQIDYNFTTLRDFVNTLAAQIGTSLNLDGSLKTIAVGTSSIIDGAVTRPKLALDSAPYYVDQSTDANVIEIVPTPAATAYADGMMFYVYRPDGRSSNTGNVTLLIDGALTAASVRRPGGTQVNAGEIAPNTVFALFCVDAVNRIFHLLASQSIGVTGGGGGAISTEGSLPYNGSFENVTTGETAPDGWVATVDTSLGGGGNPSLESVGSEAATKHGSKALKFVLATGVNMDWIAVRTSNFMECAEGDPMFVDWRMKIEPGVDPAINIPVRFTALWYGYDQTVVSATPSTNFINRNFTTATAGTTYPSSWARFFGLVKVPAGARYMKLDIACGEANGADHNNALVYIDHVKLSTTVPPNLSRRAFHTYALTNNPAEHAFMAPANAWCALVECIGQGGSSTVGGSGTPGASGAYAASVVSLDPIAGIYAVNIAAASGTVFGTSTVVAANAVGWLPGTTGTGTFVIAGQAPNVYFGGSAPSLFSNVGGGFVGPGAGGPQISAAIAGEKGAVIIHIAPTFV